MVEQGGGLLLTAEQGGRVSTDRQTRTQGCWSSWTEEAGLAHLVGAASVEEQFSGHWQRGELGSGRKRL